MGLIATIDGGRYKWACLQPLKEAISSTMPQILLDACFVITHRSKISVPKLNTSSIPTYVGVDNPKELT